MKKLLIIIPFIFLFGCTESFKRTIKDVKSNWTGGLERTCSVHSLHTGEVIAGYKGHIDLAEPHSTGRILFHVDGRRVILQNVGLICEEVK